MACPQKENGYTPIANEIMEKIVSSGLNGTEIAIILHILRKTYGYNKKEDEISLSQFLLAIPVSKRYICKALNNLQLVNIITLVKKGMSKNSSNLWTFNKDYDNWQLVKKWKLVNKTTSTSEQKGKKLVNNSSHTKDNYKRQLQKTIATDVAEVIPNLLLDKNKHIQIIGLYARAKKVDFQTKDQLNSFIKRNLRSASDLKSYEIQRVIDTIKYLIENADYKWTLETVGKYIDEDLTAIKRIGFSEDDEIKKAALKAQEIIKKYEHS